MSLLFGFILFLNAIEASIMLYHSLRTNIYPNWNSVKWRLLVDTITALVLYIVLLVTHRYNRYAMRNAAAQSSDRISAAHTLTIVCTFEFCHLSRNNITSHRDSPRTSELWNTLLSSVREKLTTGSQIDTTVGTMKEGSVSFANPAELCDLTASSKKSSIAAEVVQV